MAKASPVVEERFTLDSLQTMEYVDDRGWYSVKLALGPQNSWREHGGGRWEPDGEETISPPSGSGARPIVNRRYRLIPAIHTVDPVDGKIVNGLISASNRWIASNQFARQRNERLYDRAGNVSQLALVASVGRMLAVLDIEPTDPPPSLSNTPEAIAAATGRAIVQALLEAGVIAAGKGK